MVELLTLIVGLAFGLYYFVTQPATLGGISQGGG
jgi:hypothetical protein